MQPPFLLFDDARRGGAMRCYRRPTGIVRAVRIDAVRPALAQLRAALREGQHVAGYLSYEAGFALDPALAGLGRDGDRPLLWFGLFDRVETLAPAALPDGAGAAVGAPVPRWPRAAYLAAVARVRDQLFAGDYYQANLTFGCDVMAAGDPRAIHARLRVGARGGWGGVIAHDDCWLVSESPEQFFTIQDGIVETRPMKGTAMRAVDPARDRAAAAALQADSKNRAENLMIVDLMRNDLARISEPGSVEVPSLFAIETYPTLHQMVSVVRARLRPDLNAVDVIEAMFPCGSVTGAPKVAVMRALATLEPEARGAYTGSMGWIEPGGDAAFNVMIRTLEGRHGAARARLGLGSGLVVDSVAGDEWNESLLKGEFVRRAASRFDLIETMRFDPDAGIVALDRHLARLGASAAALDFLFDRHEARNELQAATFGRRVAAKVRLLLSPTGRMAVETRALEPMPPGPVRVTLAPSPVDPGDVRLQHKTSDRHFYDAARAASSGFDVLFVDRDGFLTEGAISNIFVDRDGTLLTPPAARGLFSGLLRESLIAEGRAREADLTPDDLAGGFFIGNMVRGLMPARLG